MPRAARRLPTSVEGIMPFGPSMVGGGLQTEGTPVRRSCGMAMSPRARHRHTGVPRPDDRTEVVLVWRDTELAAWPLEYDGRHDLSSIDDLARLQLAARRLG